MSRAFTTGLCLLLTAAALPSVTRAADPAAGKPGRAAAAATSHTPRLYVAKGPAGKADLDRLTAALAKLPGVSKVDARPEFGAITVTVEGDGSSTQSLLSAGARAAGFAMRDVQPRYYAAAGPTSEASLEALRAALAKVHGVDKVALGERVGGAAVRLLAVAPHGVVVAAGKAAGYQMEAVASYVASGSTVPADLAQLRSAVNKVAGVQRLEMQSLTGGATFLLHGEVDEALLVAAARAKGYALWLLTNPSGPRLFRIEGNPGSGEQQKLREALQALEGIGKVEMVAGSDGSRLSVAGGRVRPDAITAAAKEAGFTLAPLEAPVTLPTATPAAGRSTPPDYDERVLEEAAHLGKSAPGFTVLGMDGATKISLAGRLTAKKPVVLVFGSCTCPRFINACPPLESLYQRYKDRVNFLLVYIAEAHPGQILSVPTSEGGSELRVIPVISSQQDSLDNLRRLMRISKLSMPAGIDTAEKTVNRDYAAYPNRLYVIDAEGKVAFKGAPGPTGLKVPDLAEWLQANVK